MSNKVDRLFKNKLESDALQPSAQAWEKVEAHLGKKNKVVVWRIAAGVVLLGVLTFVGLKWNETEPVKELAKKEIEVRSQEPEVQEQKKEIEPLQNIAEQKEPIKKVRKEKEKPVVEGPVVIEQQVAIIEEPITNNQQPATNIEQPTTKKGITLTYSLPSIKKQEEPVVAQTPPEPKKTGLERVLEIARDVKNGDSPLGELREAKDDILALDFRKDKKQKH